MVENREDTNRLGREVESLRSELKLRILLQNLVIIVSIGLFALVVGAAVLSPAAAWPLAAVENVTLLAAALVWCHHGVRTAQIKKYLLLRDANENGWERWLPESRPATLLGSRWVVSTKGVFLGLGAASMAIASFVSSEFESWALFASVGVWTASAIFLFTNLKE